MLIRPACEGDLPALTDIMNYYRENTSYIWDRTPLDAPRARAWLAEHSHPYCAIVAESGGAVLGYASLSRFRQHSGYAKTAEDSIYLRPGLSGRGYGGALMRGLLRLAADNGFYTLTAWIDSENTPSVEFHTRFGFETVGSIKNAGVLDGQKRSVVIMSADLLALKDGD